LTRTTKLTIGLLLALVGSAAHGQAINYGHPNWCYDPNRYYEEGPVKCPKEKPVARPRKIKTDLDIRRDAIAAFDKQEAANTPSASAKKTACSTVPAISGRRLADRAGKRIFSL